MTVRGWRVLVVVLLTVVVVLAVALVVATRAVRAAEDARRQATDLTCSVVLALDDAYRQSPPQTPVGQRIAESIAAVREQVGCPTP